MSKIKNFKLRINLSDPAELLRSFFKVFFTLYIRFATFRLNLTLVFIL